MSHVLVINLNSVKLGQQQRLSPYNIHVRGRVILLKYQFLISAFINEI